jgi:hypothetical protein
MIEGRDPVEFSKWLEEREVAEGVGGVLARLLISLPYSLLA